MLENIDLQYEGDLTERYMCISKEAGPEDFREKMLMLNEITGYLPLKVQKEGDEKCYMYRISDNISLREYLSDKPVSVELLELLLIQFEKIFIRGKSYAFEQDNFILHPDTIFFSNDKSLCLCYLPGYYKPIREQLSDLLGYLLDLVDVSDKYSVYVVYTTFTLAKQNNSTFRMLLESLRESKPLEEEESEAFEDSREEAGNEKRGELKQKSQKLKLFLGGGLLAASVVTLLAFFILI